MIEQFWHEDCLGARDELAGNEGLGLLCGLAWIKWLASFRIDSCE